MKNTKVAIWGSQFGFGGVGHVCSDLGKELGRRGYDVDFLVDGEYCESSYLQKKLPSNCSVIRFTEETISGGRLKYYSSLFWGILNYLRSYERVFVFSNCTKWNLISTWASGISKTSVVLSLTEHTTLQQRLSGLQQIIPPLVYTFYPLADQVVGVSEDITDELSNSFYFEQENCLTIPNPVNVSHVREQSKEPVSHPWFSEDIPVIIGVGRIVPAKQFSVLVEALRWLDTVRLILIGDGPRKESLTRQVENAGLKDQVDFLGFVSNPYKYMRRADILGITSRREGCPIVALEALSCGTPVVSTDCPGGNSEILAGGKYGPLVEVGSPRQLADAVSSVLADPPDPNRLVERARDFDVRRIADRYEQVIRDGTKRIHSKLQT